MQVSTIELQKLRVAWLALENIQTKYFMKNFKPIWNDIIKEVTIILQKSNYDQNVCNVGKVGLTLDPSIGFAFSPIMESYRINIWSLLFCVQKEELSAFFNPSYLIASKLMHEYSHFKFWKLHNALGTTKQSKEQFSSNYGVEDEKYALTEELSFLNQMIELTSPCINIILFRVKSWDYYGQPICEGINAEFLLQDNILQRIGIIENTLKQMSSKETYDKKMTKCAKERHSDLSLILKLNLEKQDWPTVSMKI